ncbi:MAG: hypothetical protein R2810_00780 [Flavobacteriales bacterium]
MTDHRIELTVHNLPGSPERRPAALIDALQLADCTELQAGRPPDGPTDLIACIRATRSLLCVGLDTEPGRVPDTFRRSPDPVGSHSGPLSGGHPRPISGHKFNLAFYEALGAAGWESLERTLEAMPKDVPLIADAKRATSATPRGSMRRPSSTGWASML